MSKYEKYEKKDLISYIIELEKQLKTNKYGLYWDKSIQKENTIVEFLNKIPILINNDTTTLNNNGLNHLLIEGDNFYTLSLLNMINNGKGMIDIIYIDPPYNTGNEDFSYNDKFVNKDDGYRHSKWLTMISSRLKLGREILKDNGVIFISIDDNELYNLKLLCDQIFGETNFIGNLIWKSNPNGRGDSNYLGTIFEYVLVYRKSQHAKFRYENQSLEQFNLTDEKGVYAEQILHSKLSYSVGMDYPITAPDGSMIYAGNVTKEEWQKRKSDKSVKKAMTWRFGESTFKSELESGEVVFKSVNGIWKVYRKRRPIQGGSAPFKNYYDLEGTRHGSNELKDIFINPPFDHPKPVGLIKYLLKLVDIPSPTVLDFFAGSGTTGHAVLELNKEDNEKRRFILCTNNEKNICTDVTYPRLKTVITGIRPNGTKYSDGINANLNYFKCGFIPKIENTDQAKYNLVEKVNNLLCIQEDVFKLLETSTNHYVYQSNDREKEVFIYIDYYEKNSFLKFKRRILESKARQKVVYMFSIDNVVDDLLFKGIKSVEIKPIPSKIYEIYKDIVEEIKGG